MFYQEAPEIAETIPEQEDKLQQLEKHMDPNNYNYVAARSTVSKHLLDVFRDALDSPEGLERVDGILNKLSQHHDPHLRIVLVKNIPRLALFCSYSDRLDYVSTRLWPLLRSCIWDTYVEVRETSEISLLVLMKGKLLGQEVLDSQVCPCVVEVSKLECHATTLDAQRKKRVLVLFPVPLTKWLSYVEVISQPALMSGVRKSYFEQLQRHRQDFVAERRLGRGSPHKVVGICELSFFISQPALMSGSQPHGSKELMGKMAPLIGKEATEKHFLDRFVHMCSNEKVIIRQMCAKSLGDMCTVLGTEITEKYLLPIFVQLCRDEDWEVRLSCAEVSISLSCCCSLDTRKTVLAAAFTDLLMDSDIFVRVTAFGCLGAFICTFADPSITKLDYDENGELIFLGQDGFEFRMPTINYSLSNIQSSSTRDLESIESVRDGKSFFPGEPRILDQSLNISNALRFIVEKSSNHISWEGLNPNQRLFKMMDQSLSEASWTPDEKECSPSDHQTDNDEADDSFNTFRFWRTSLPELSPLEREPEQDEIRTNLNILDNELSSLSEKLAECSTADLEEIKTESVISLASSPDSGWNSSETTPHVESTPIPALKLAEALPNTVMETSPSAPPAACEVNLPNQEIVPQLLLDYFVSMTVPWQTEMKDKEMAQDCAYCLPAVALTLGPNNWPYIKNAYKCLSMNIKWRVRRTVVSSIHKLASILGEEIASRDLAPIFEGFIRDLDEVKVVALEHLADFLKQVKPETRVAFLPRLKEFLETDFDWNWRYREEFGKQLRLLISLFKPVDWLQHFEPLATLLLCDKVAAVRRKAVLLFLDLLKNLCEEPQFQEKLLYILLKEFAEHSSWRRRQVFVLVCSKIAEQNAIDTEEFCTVLLDQLLLLCKDPVPNVGLCVARCLSLDVISREYISPSSPYYSTIIEALEQLKSHQDPDIKYFAGMHEEPETRKDSDTPSPPTGLEA